jgi:hypothetical protein
LNLFSLPIPSLERFYDEAVPIIPLAELSSLFRQPDYSAKGRRTWPIAGDLAIAEVLMAA